MKVTRLYLKLLRKKHHISAPKMAKLLGLSCRQHYLRIENGERDLITDEIQQKYYFAYAEIFNMPVKYFIEEEQKFIQARKLLENSEKGN